MWEQLRKRIPASGNPVTSNTANIVQIVMNDYYACLETFLMVHATK
jgi:hypothetical protein